MKMFSKILIIAAVSCTPLIALKSLASEEIDMTFEPRIVEIDRNEKPAVGSAISNPIVFEKLKNYRAYKFKRDNYLAKNFEGYHITVDTVMFDNKGNIIQGFVLTDDDGNTANVYFDVDDVFRKYKRIDDKELSRRVESLLKNQKK